MAVAVPEEDSWVVVDKTSGGTLRAKASHESLSGSDSEDDGSGLGGSGGGNSSSARVHVRGSQATGSELLEWIGREASEAATGQRNSLASKCSYRTNSSSAGGRQRRSSSVHSGSSESLEVASDATEGTFVVRIVEVRQVGATRPINVQCAAQVGEERIVIPHVMTRPKDYNTWAARMDDTFAFDVTRPFTFNLGVYATPVAAPPAQRAVGLLPHRLSLAARRHVGRNSMASDSAPSLAPSGSSTKTTAKIRAGFRRFFGPRPGGEAEAAYVGYAAGGSGALGLDPVVSAETTDDHGRRIEVQQHAIPDPIQAESELPDLQQAQPPRHARLTTLLPNQSSHHRLSTLLPRARAGSVASAAAAFAGRGRASSCASNASDMSSAPVQAQPVGELFLDLRLERREKRRATFILPIVNQEQAALRGGAHVEMSVVLEFGIIVRETPAERARRQQRAEAQEAAELKAAAQRQWDAADERDRATRLRGPLSVFTRSGRLSTWRRYWAELSASHVLFFDKPGDHTPASSMPLLHLSGAGVPSSDLVSIGPTGIELRLSPQAMTDRHRRTSAYPRGPVDRDRTLTSAPKYDNSDAELDDWQCRVYLLLDNLPDRDRWLHELSAVAVPSAERARQRMQQRRAACISSADDTESLRLSGKHLQVVAAAQALEKLSLAQHTAYAKKVFVDSIGHRVVSMSAVGVPHDLDDATLIPPTAASAARKPVAMAFGKPATFSLSIAPDSAAAYQPPPAKKRLRARRRSNSTADIRQQAGNNRRPPSSSDDEAPTAVATSKPLNRKGSTVLEVVGKAMERRPGTVSRRFLFVWNVNEI
ncbi:hypothetical protein H4R26_000060 [Coemansia thaxteri]|uniref:PH domain-containing protein n=1 Tax=Coemansia thaxteri TaxID=2663907 RepID=A0A9W8BI55_9FUNG|nr:hypothetical protein H4R26_000060 [Coemansia thaxteri]KAJ2488164.1 hypothetical protein EV174_000132 [Coemansia sp. RSA 2320]